MSLLPESLASWIVIAVLLFWFVGAYNRLVRLRAAVLQSYGTLDAGGMAALATALQVWIGAWQRQHPDAVTMFEPDGTLARPAQQQQPPSLQGAPDPIAWPEPSAAAEIARNQFNLAVKQYNAAIAQFPAVLVAWAVRLRPAAPLL